MSAKGCLRGPMSIYRYPHRLPTSPPSMSLARSGSGPFQGGSGGEGQRLAGGGGGTCALVPTRGCRPGSHGRVPPPAPRGRCESIGSREACWVKGSVGSWLDRPPPGGGGRGPVFGSQKKGCWVENGCRLAPPCRSIWVNGGQGDIGAEEKAAGCFPASWELQCWTPPPGGLGCPSPQDRSCVRFHWFMCFGKSAQRRFVRFTTSARPRALTHPQRYSFGARLSSGNPRP